jgi:hypothetical protein
MVTTSLQTGREFDLSAQFAQIVEAAEQAAAKPASFATSCAKQLLTGLPPRSPSGQQASDVTGIGDALDTRRHEMRRCPAQSVQQRLGIDGKKLRTT